MTPAYAIALAYLAGVAHFALDRNHPAWRIILAVGIVAFVWWLQDVVRTA